MRFFTGVHPLWGRMAAQGAGKRQVLFGVGGTRKNTSGFARPSLTIPGDCPKTSRTCSTGSHTNHSILASQTELLTQRLLRKWVNSGLPQRRWSDSVSGFALAQQQPCGRWSTCFARVNPRFARPSLRVCGRTSGPGGLDWPDPKGIPGPAVECRRTRPVPGIPVRRVC